TETFVGREPGGRLAVDRRDRLVDQRFGLVAIALCFGDGEADAVVVHEEGPRIRSDRSLIAFDELPDLTEVDAAADDTDEDPVRRLDRRREEQGRLVGDNGVTRVADVDETGPRVLEVIAEPDVSTLIGLNVGVPERHVEGTDRERLI